MNCKKCGNSISNDSLFCSFCGAKQKSETSSSQKNSNVNTSTNVNSSANHKKKPTAFIVLGILLAFILLIVLLSNNSFGSSVRSSHFSYDYTVRSDRIEINFTALADIKDFFGNFQCYNGNSILPIAGKHIQIDYLKKGDTITYIWTKEEITESASWVESLAPLRVDFGSFHGKIRNKDK